jgi:hypothetical protein
VLRLASRLRRRAAAYARAALAAPLVATLVACSPRPPAELAPSCDAAELTELSGTLHVVWGEEETYHLVAADASYTLRVGEGAAPAEGMLSLDRQRVRMRGVARPDATFHVCAVRLEGAEGAP